MARSRRNRKPVKRAKNRMVGRIAFAALVVAAVLALAFFLIMRDQQRTSIAENAVGSIFSPIQNAVSSATSYMRAVFKGLRDYGEMSKNYESAKREIESLKLQLSALEQDAEENKRLAELLDAKQRTESMDPIYARVIARDPGVWFDSFSINRGTLDGVQVNMSVVTGDGLVGRVYEVGVNYAKVLSIIDTRSAVACLIERTRDNGVLRGQISADAANAECYMYYLPTVNDVAPGDVVLTSGVDTLYPKGLTVGTVTAVSRQSDSSTQYIVVAPAVDFQHVEDVLVLRTLVETDQEKLPVVPTPTPRPTPVPTPAPLYTEDPNATPTPAPDDGMWYWPTPLPEGMEPGMETPEPTPSPTPTIDPSTLMPEDVWALD